jgi:hypothetical protein
MSLRFSGTGGRFLLSCVGPTGLAIICCHSSTVAAAKPETPNAETPASACPSRQAVVQAVRTLLGRSKLEADGPGDRLDRPDLAIDVRDLGDRYSVSVKGNNRSYRDAARDCDARARAAAVFVALTLVPSSVEAAERDDRSRERAATAPPPSPAPAPAAGLAAEGPPGVPHSWGAQVEVGALGAIAPRTDTSQFVIGGELRFVVTAASWGLSLGGSLPTSSTFDPGAVRVREARYPVDVSVRRFWTSRWLRVALDAGVLAALCQLRQVDQPTAGTSTRFEAGGRAAATLATESASFGLYIRAFSEVVPFPRPIAVEPQGIIGRTSSFWMGATVGVAARFH